MTVGVAVIVTVYGEEGVGTDRQPQAALIADGAYMTEAVRDASDIEPRDVSDELIPDDVGAAVLLGGIPDGVASLDVVVAIGEPLRASVDASAGKLVAETGMSVVISPDTTTAYMEDISVEQTEEEAVVC